MVGRNRRAAILHTWGSNLHYHAPIHCVVTGGGVYKDGVWHPLEGCRQAKSFLFPVQALSKVFRAKFMDLLTSALKDIGKAFPDDIRKRCMEKGWVVYSRPPAKEVNQVLEYIGRYAYRVAICNSRILDCNPGDGKVTYDWKYYRQDGKHKIRMFSQPIFISQTVLSSRSKLISITTDDEYLWRRTGLIPILVAQCPYNSVFI